MEKKVSNKENKMKKVYEELKKTRQELKNALSKLVESKVISEEDAEKYYNKFNEFQYMLLGKYNSGYRFNICSISSARAKALINYLKGKEDKSGLEAFSSKRSRDLVVSLWNMEFKDLKLYAVNTGSRYGYTLSEPLKWRCLLENDLSKLVSDKLITKKEAKSILNSWSSFVEKLLEYKKDKPKYLNYELVLNDRLKELVLYLQSKDADFGINQFSTSEKRDLIVDLWNSSFDQPKLLKIGKYGYKVHGERSPFSSLDLPQSFVDLAKKNKMNVAEYALHYLTSNDVLKLTPEEWDALIPFFYVVCEQDDRAKELIRNKISELEKIEETSMNVEFLERLRLALENPVVLNNKERKMVEKIKASKNTLASISKAWESIK